jgi:hypothetical protein
MVQPDCISKLLIIWFNSSMEFLKHKIFSFISVIYDNYVLKNIKKLFDTVLSAVLDQKEETGIQDILGIIAIIGIIITIDQMLRYRKKKILSLRPLRFHPLSSPFGGGTL